MNKSIILQTKLEKQIIPHFIKAYNYKCLDESRKIRAMICEHQSQSGTTSMSNIRRGLPLTRFRPEQIFPKLTPAQIRRIAAHGHSRAIQSDEVLVEQGDSACTVLCSGLRRDRDCAPGRLR